MDRQGEARPVAAVARGAGLFIVTLCLAMAILMLATICFGAGRDDLSGERIETYGAIAVAVTAENALLFLGAAIITCAHTYSGDSVVRPVRRRAVVGGVLHAGVMWALSLDPLGRMLALLTGKYLIDMAIPTAACLLLVLPVLSGVIMGRSVFRHPVRGFAVTTRNRRMEVIEQESR